MSNLEKIEAAEKVKQMGNDLYKIGKFQRASKKYDKVMATGAYKRTFSGLNINNTL